MLSSALHTLKIKKKTIRIRFESIIEKCSGKDLIVLMGHSKLKVEMENTGYEDIKGRCELGECNEGGWCCEYFRS